MVIDNRSINS